MGNRKTEADYRALAEKMGYKIVGDIPPNTKTKTDWQCSCGYVWAADYNHISRGQGCPKCADRQPRTPDQYRQIAAKSTLEWLGPEVPNVFTKTGWRCLVCGHEWQARYNNIQQGQRCPQCRPKRISESKLIKPEKFHLLAFSFGVRWLGPEVKGTNRMTWWECPLGHKFKTTIDSLKRSKGCQKCRKLQAINQSRYTEAYYKELATQRGFIFIGPLPRNTSQKTTWQCPKGHKWESNYDNIKGGNGCPDCSKSRGEVRIKEVLDQLGVEYETQKRFDNCRRKKPLPFDFYLVDIHTLIEYDGELHFVASRYTDGDKRLKRTQENDTTKDKFAKDNGLTLIRIPYTEYDQIETIITNLVMLTATTSMH